MSPLAQLRQWGQSIWLDYIRRGFIHSGELRRLITEDGLSGVTINPTILEKAIAGSTDYDDALRLLLAADPHAETPALYEALAIEDVRMTADELRPVYDATGGADGFVSLEVAPALAHDTARTVAEARRLWREVGRPNLMIKVPATSEGIPAIEQLTAEGVNVNITLMFSLAHYDAVARAYLRGMARCPDPRRVASVASFFVSRIDTAVDRALDAIGTPGALALRGRIAIHSARAVYRRFLEVFHGEPFAALRGRGARAQRVLWASTGTKDPAYADVRYVEELIGPDTVTTLPPATLAAFRDHGRVRGATVTEDGAEAESAFEALQALGVELGAITENLQADGVAAFEAALRGLFAALETRRAAILTRRVDRQRLSLGGYQERVAGRWRAWEEARFQRRLWAKDSTLWSPTPAPEITDRLGWLTLPEVMHEHVDALTAFAQEVRAEGVRHVVLLGMGGSSLAPEVFQRTFGNAAGYPALTVLDSTHPAAVRAVDAAIDVRRSLILVSSKSGTTTETLSLFRYFWRRAGELVAEPGARFAAITDPGTPLARLARERGFRRILLAPPDVGGRYSALSVFGMVPAALIGVDIGRVLDRAWRMAEANASCVSCPDSPGLTLGAALGELALAGRDKVTFLTSCALDALPSWIEQLIAESTGKDGKGIVPVVDEPAGPPDAYGHDRLFVCLRLAGDEPRDLDVRLDELEAARHPVIRLDLTDKADIGQEFFRWEIAVAAAGTVLGIHPFNQPDVQLAKELAEQAMRRGGGRAVRERADPAPAGEVAADRRDALEDALRAWLATARAGDYVGVQAYLAPSAEVTAALSAIRRALRDRLRLATTAGYGPRFLHSTGQLHKGGPDSGLFLQIVDEPEQDLAVPETDYTFGALIRAQALGDLAALRRRGRRVARVQLGADVTGGLARVTEALRRG